jgi:hypothetical protein
VAVAAVVVPLTLMGVPPAMLAVAAVVVKAGLAVLVALAVIHPLGFHHLLPAQQVHAWLRAQVVMAVEPAQ